MCVRSIKAQETRAGKTFFKLLALHTNQPQKTKQAQGAGAREEAREAGLKSHSQ